MYSILFLIDASYKFLLEIGVYLACGHAFAHSNAHILMMPQWVIYDRQNRDAGKFSRSQVSESTFYTPASLNGGAKPTKPIRRAYPTPANPDA